MRTLIIGILFIGLTLASMANAHVVRHRLRAMEIVNVALGGNK